MTKPMVSEDQLTAAQRRWLDHIRQQQHSGLSMAAYARQQGLAMRYCSITRCFYPLIGCLLPFIPPPAYP
ncbi:IS66 family insertion sequence element accessory protein TnpA [Methylomonas koyamae]|uniref:IS66 family insertion sequence element accessory protein TnpA n=1 Tax=Methylomonas koyamae TaxID=702114 RepID=UPI000B16616B|nr:hypothetical protein [Methylomonas koyamae]